MINYDAILIEPVLSEKTNSAREDGKYVFKVDARATKTMIKEAVRRMFNVHPVSCNIVNVTPKPKRQRQSSGYTSSWKKAYVKLAANETIAVFEGA